MILNCPSCWTRYLVDPATLGAEGRRVRCARCAHTWFAPPPADRPKTVEVVPRPEEPVPIPVGSNLPVIRERAARANWAGWAVLAVIVGSVVGGGVLARERIVTVWPPAARLYQMAGFAVASTQPRFELRNVRSERERGGTALIVEGELVSLSGEVLDVPGLTVELRGGDGAVLAEWSVAAQAGRLGPGEATAFRSRLERPPSAATGLVVRIGGD